MASMMMLADMQICPVFCINPNVGGDQHANSNLQGFADIMAIFHTMIVPAFKLAKAQGMTLAVYFSTDGTASAPGGRFEDQVTNAPNTNIGADNAGREQQSLFVMKGDQSKPVSTTTWQANGHDPVSGNVLLNANSTSALGQADGRTQMGYLVAASALKLFTGKVPTDPNFSKIIPEIVT
jgi:hypothetical protein